MTLMSSSDWAEMTFGGLDLGDSRRSERVVRMASTLAAHPEKTLPQAFSTWAELKAAYRMLSDPRMTYETLTRSHFESTRRQCTEAGEYLLVDDTTQLDFTTHRAVHGLGRIGDDGGRGLMMHTTLALGVQAWGEQESARLVGLWDQQLWRRMEGPRKKRETKAQRLARPRESDCWGRALAGCSGPPEGVQWIFVADREADIYEMFSGRLPVGVDLVIRASRPRRIDDDAGRMIFEAVAQARALGEMTVEIRNRPGQPARQARLRLRARRVCLRPPWRPDRKLAPVEINVVQASEEDPPDGASALHWVLLTTLPVENFAQARRVVWRYEFRWLIEEYHKALKSGTRIEEAQLSTVERIEALLGVLAMVAARLLQAKLVARIEPEQKADERICTESVQRVLEAAVGRPKRGWTNREFIRAIARLGGFLGRRHDGEPGWQTIWRGWNVLVERVEGYLIAQGEWSCG